MHPLSCIGLSISSFPFLFLAPGLRTVHPLIHSCIGLTIALFSFLFLRLIQRSLGDALNSTAPDDKNIEGVSTASVKKRPSGDKTPKTAFQLALMKTPQRKTAFQLASLVENATAQDSISACLVPLKAPTPSVAYHLAPRSCLLTP